MIELTLSANQNPKDKKAKDLGPINPVGQPSKFAPGKDSMYAVWYKDGQWHLRSTSNDQAIFEGGISVQGGRIVGGNFNNLEKVANPKTAGKADWVSLDPAGKGFRFRFATGKATDGIDFKVSESAEAVVFDLKYQGEGVPKRILIGKGNRYPEETPFSFPANPRE
jgi:hypothetical protein